MSTIEEPAAASAAQNVALWDIFTTFVRISVMSFGGSTAAWSYRAVVEERNWVTSRQPDDLPAFNQAMLSLFSSSLVAGHS